MTTHIHHKPHPLFKIAADETKDASSVTGGLKVVKNTLSFFSEISKPVKESAAAISTMSFIGFTTDTFKALGFFKSISSIVEQTRRKTEKGADTWARNFKIAADVNAIGVAVLTGAKVAKQIKILDFAKVGAALGKVPLLGKVTAAIPFATGLSVLEIIVSAFNITASSFKIHALGKRAAHVDTHINTWKSPELALKKIKDKAEKHKDNSEGAKWQSYITQGTDPERIKSLCHKKAEKWVNKAHNLRKVERLKEIKSIVINTIAIVSVVASLVFGFGAPVALGLLLVAILSLGDSLHNKYLLKTKDASPVPVPS